MSTTRKNRSRTTDGCALCKPDRVIFDRQPSVTFAVNKLVDAYEVGSVGHFRCLPGSRAGQRKPLLGESLILHRSTINIRSEISTNSFCALQRVNDDFRSIRSNPNTLEQNWKFKKTRTNRVWAHCTFFLFSRRHALLYVKRTNFSRSIRYYIIAGETGIFDVGNLVLVHRDESAKSV